MTAGDEDVDSAPDIILIGIQINQIHGAVGEIARVLKHNTSITSLNLEVR